MPVAVGVVGVGALGRHHVRVLSEEPRARLVGAYDPHPERAAHAEAAGGRAFASFEALLEECEAIVVAAPTRRHREVAGRALERGRHCLVEKPLAATTAECDLLCTLAEANDRILHVGHVERMNPAVRAARPRIREPRFIEVHRLAGFVPRGVDVDVLLDLMIHDLDLILDWVGEEPSSVSGVGVRVLTASEDIANARLEFPGGCVADVTSSRVSQEKMRKIRIFQEDAYFSLDCVRGVTEIVEADRAALAAAAIAESASRSGRDLASLVSRRELPRLDGEPLALEVEAFVRACQGDAPPSGVSPADGAAGRRAVALAETLRAGLRERARRWEG